MTASMIIALGPQNAHLLKYGLMRKTTVFNIAAIYVLIDIVLITFGALGVGSLIAEAPLLKLIFSIIAVGFFLIYGLISIRSAFKPRSAQINLLTTGTGYSTAVLISIANPAVLFDTIVIIGGLAGQYEQISERIAFLVGAATASFLWFAAISAASFYASSYVTGDKVWKILDLIIGTLMIFLAFIISSNVIDILDDIGWLIL
jgi:L-lysine exporter family protein LysE/ArgO